MAVYSVDKVGGKWYIFKDGKQEPGEGAPSRNAARAALDARLKEAFQNRGKKKTAEPAVEDTT